MAEHTLTDTYAVRKPNVSLQRSVDKAVDIRTFSMQATGRGLKRPPPAAAGPPKSRLHMEASNHSRLDSLLGEVGRSTVGPHKENKAPTDFSNVRSLVANTINAPFARRTQQQKAAVKQSKGFDDINSLAAVKQQAQPDALAAHNALKGVLAQNFSLPPPDAAPAPSCSQRSTQTQTLGTAPVPAVAAAPAAAPVLPAAAWPPIDWALRTCMRFASSRPFALCEDEALVSGAWTAISTDDHSASGIEERYQAALQTYAHPEAPMEQGVVAALMASGRSGPELLKARRAAWDAAFTALFQQLRNGATDAFYYVSPQDTRKTAFVALFRVAGLGGCAAPHVLVSRSSAGLRQLLREEAVEFSMPLAPGLAAEEASAAELLADVEGTNVGKAVVARDALAAVDGQPQSLLAIVGETDVAGLAEVLCNHRARLCEGTCDVPQLLAPTPFAGAHLARMQPQVTITSLAAKAGAARRRINGPQFRVQLEGLIPPWVADRLCIVLAEAQGAGGLQGNAEALPLAACLNVAPPDLEPDEDATQLAADAAAAPGAWRRRGYVCGEELHRWRTATPGLSGAAVVDCLDYSSGRFRCKLRQARVGPATAGSHNLHGWQ